MNILKTTKILCLAVVGWVVCVAFDAQAAVYTNEVDGIQLEWTFTPDGSNATLTKMTNVTDEVDATFPIDVEIPPVKDSAGKEYKITGIGNAAFRNNTNIKSLKMPSVTWIGDGASKVGAFTGCSKLERVEMPELTYLGKYAFYHVTSLKSVVMPKVQTVAIYALNGATSLTGDYEFKYLTQIGNANGGNSYSFHSTAITSIKIPEITALGAYAFTSCGSLTNVVMPKITVIKDKVFQFCRKLGGNYELHNLTSLSSSSHFAESFQNPELKARIYFPLIQYLNKPSFSECTYLTNAILPSLRGIYDSAFFKCENLKEIKLPWCMTELSGSPFSSSGITRFFVHNDSSFAITKTDAEIRSAADLDSSVKVIRYGGVVENEAYTNETDKVTVTWFYDDYDTPGYDLSDVATIVGATNAIGKVEMPDRVDGKRVTALGDAAFYFSNYANDIRQIKLGKYVTHVGVKAFNPPAKKEDEDDTLTVLVYEANVDLYDELKNTYSAAIEAGTFKLEKYKGGGFRIILR